MSSPTMTKSERREETVLRIRAVFKALRARGLPNKQLVDELAAFVNVDFVTVYRWLNGDAKPIPALIQPIHNGLDQMIETHGS